MQVNIQPIEKYVSSTGEYLDVHSIFNTIQGEGPFAGWPAVFIRLAGCNLQCPGCDTDYTNGRKRMSVPDIVDQVFFYKEAQRGLVVITGGEPFRQHLSELCCKLVDLGFQVQIESNGSLPPQPFIPDSVVIVCSPKTGKIHPIMMLRADAFKYVLAADSVNPEDGLPMQALGHTSVPHVARPPKDDKRYVYLQPMDAKNAFTNAANVEAVKQSCMKHGYILQLQIHKIINVE